MLLGYLGGLIWRADTNGHWYLTSGPKQPWFRIF